MNNLLLFLRANSSHRFGISRVTGFGVRFYSSAEAVAVAVPTTSPVPNDTLQRRIARAGHPSTSMAALLDQWLEEGNDVKQSLLTSLIKQLRCYRRFHHALQVLEWMSVQRNYSMSAADMAVRVDLICKVHGLEQAEKYFSTIPDDLRNFQVYGSLLNCYTHTKFLEKAEPLMERMRDLGFVKTILPYNIMLNLYSQHGKYENMDNLMEEMKQRGINADRFSYNIRLNAYGAASDIEGMEKFLGKIEADPNVSMDWNAYSNAANYYFKAGLVDKSMAMLKKSEDLIKGKVKRFAYEVLLTQYATARKKDEVHRIWSLYKNLGHIKNAGYICIISSLMKLDDFDGAETIFGEWDKTHENFDIRIPNVMINGYCQKGLLEKADACLNSVIDSGKEPNAFTWGNLANGYRVHGLMAKSVEMMKRSIQASQHGWKPNSPTLAACLDYLRFQGDMEAAEELVKLLREHGHSPEDIINNESLDPQAADQIAEGETQEIVGFEDKEV